ncbi:MAG: PhnD/SsuA/transferrin family substrate-binding protein [Actinomycetota bacterium]|nr:PhnD/SsuA/transferrin family substrate-binding protein [Actinomycetota bacterium]
MADDLLRFATFLAPNMFGVYRFVADYVGEELGHRVELIVGSSFDQFSAGQADVGFICGLPYVQLARQPSPPVELLAAPVLQGARYRGRPIYFSDVIVRADSGYRSFSDLRGCSWAYNDLDSHSGYNVTRHRLVQMGEISGYFGRVVEGGSHQRSIRMVCNGEVDAAAIDSQVLAVELRDHPALKSQLRVIDTLGPAGIQPVVAASRLPDALKVDIREVLLDMGDDPVTRAGLAPGLIERFVTVTDEDYHDVRAMLAAADDANFLTLR